MSAIWGMIDLSGKEIDIDQFQTMKHSFSGCCIDRFDEIIEGNAAIGCAHQFFTKESMLEQLPILINNKLFTADAIIDNRAELLELLKHDGQVEQKAMETELPDSFYLRKMFDEYGASGVNKTLGAYTFMEYDKTENKLVLGADALGNRIIYYYRKETIIYFSTLLGSITAVNEVKVNDRWINDFIMMDNLSMHSNHYETPFEGVLLVPSACILTFTREKNTQEEYWKPFDTIKQRKYADEECKNRTIQVFQEAVQRVLRAKDETGIFLSGGLDSTAVACFAAKQLKAKGKKLYAYTSVPDEGYQSDEEQYYIMDESKQVKITAAFLKNIEEHYIRLAKENCWDWATELMKMYELPYKAAQNVVWMEKGMVEAKKAGCSVMLTGQYGNATISYGDYDIYCNTLLSTGHLKSLVREVNLLQQRMHVSRRRYYQNLLACHLVHKKTKPQELFNPCRNRQLQDKYSSIKRLTPISDPALFRGLTYKKSRNFMVNKTALRQIGEAETKVSLATGVMFRDPTRDKKLIEFLLTLPANQFDREGESRRLVCCYLKDYLPEALIECSKYHKGRQSADMLMNLQKSWEKIFTELESIFKRKTAARYLDIETTMRELYQLGNNIEHADPFAVMRILYMAMVVEFVDAYEEKRVMEVRA